MKVSYISGYSQSKYLNGYYSVNVWTFFSVKQKVNFIGEKNMPYFQSHLYSILFSPGKFLSYIMPGEKKSIRIKVTDPEVFFFFFFLLTTIGGVLGNLKAYFHACFF